MLACLCLKISGTVFSKTPGKSLILSPSWLVSGKAWKAYFVAIYVTIAHFACFWEGLEGIFCRYVRDYRSLSMFLGRLGGHILSLFM